MRRSSDPLDQISIPKPCPASWDDMTGDARIRHCSQCQKNVYNISEMSRREALTLIQQHEGRICIRLYRREDGKIMTTDCPKGLAVARQKVSKALLVCGGLLIASAFALARSITGREAGKTFRIEQYEPFKSLDAWAHPKPKVAPALPPRYTALAGDMVMLPMHLSKSGYSTKSGPVKP
jgi:hypothetical protein